MSISSVYNGLYSDIFSAKRDGFVHDTTHRMINEMSIMREFAICTFTKIVYW